MKIRDIFEGWGEFWFYIIDHGRGCWYNVYEDELCLPHRYNEKIVEKAIIDYVNANNVDILKLPYIEGATPAMQFVYDQLEQNESNAHYYVERDDEPADWDIIGISKEEFEKQIDSDIIKYDLEDYIEKYDYGSILYICYNQLQYNFTEKVEEE